jgi:hypothetical protein
MIWLNMLGQVILLIWALYLTFRFITRLNERTSLADRARSLLMVSGVWLMLLAALIQMFRDIDGS